MNNKIYFKKMLSVSLNKSELKELSQWQQNIEMECENLNEVEFRAKMGEYKDLLLMSKLNKIHSDVTRISTNVVFFVAITIIAIMIGVFSFFIGFIMK